MASLFSKVASSFRGKPKAAPPPQPDPEPIEIPAARSQRVPVLLQAVFLRSNRGEEVHKAPPMRMAQRTFFSNWVFRRDKKVTDTKKKAYNKKQDKVLARGAKKAKKQRDKQSGSDSSSAKGESSAEEHDEVSVATVERAPTPPPQFTLQEYFDALLKERGYDIQLHETLTTGYYNKATPLQVASYGPRMVQIVRDSNVNALRETLAVGLSPNPCNQFGESLLHMICRRSDMELLKVMMEAGSSLQVSDDFGRTPLHDAFWSAKPSYETVETIIKRDPGLFFMKDKRGALPLSYVTKPHWGEWMEWMDQNIDHYFPESNAKTYKPADLVFLKPNTFVIPDAKSTLGLELIQMVANGGLSPAEARLMAEAAARDEEEEATVANTIEDESSSYDDDSDFDSDYDSEEDDEEDDYDSDYDSDGGMEEDDMAEMLRMAMARRSTAAAAGG